jgi:hypothetical protein
MERTAEPARELSIVAQNQGHLPTTCEHDFVLEEDEAVSWMCRDATHETSRDA